VIQRVTGLMTAQGTINDLSGALQRLTATESEMSSGLKITQPSDDPYGASQVVTLNGQLSQLGSYTNNVSDGTAWLNTAGGALTDINSSLQRVRELVVEAGNGTMSAADRSSAAAEVNQLIDSIKGSANTQYNGSYLFSGTATTTAPYQSGATDTYLGDAGTVTRTIGPNTSVAVNTNISALLGSGSGDGKLLDSLRGVAADLSGGTTANGDALRTTDLTNLDGGLATLGTMQANVGALTDRLTLAASRLQSMQQTDTTQLSNTQDADLAQAAIDYSTEQAAYTAALKAGATIVQTSLVNFL
jgi:flagellar hook-associated protein 3 FlgL